MIEPAYPQSLCYLFLTLAKIYFSNSYSAQNVAFTLHDLMLFDTQDIAVLLAAPNEETFYHSSVMQVRGFKGFGERVNEVTFPTKYWNLETRNLRFK